MSIFDWVCAGLLTAAVVTGVLAIFMLVLLVKDWQKMKYLKVRRPKDKKKRKKWVAAVMRTDKMKQKHGLSLLFLTVMMLICSGIAMYGQHYQANNLGENDAKNFAAAYVLLDSTRSSIDDSGADEAKLRDTLDTAAKKLSSYGNKRASSKLSQEGQAMLNRYYSQLSQLGQNLNRQLGQMLTNEELQADFIADIEKVKSRQSQIIAHYSIKEDSIQVQK